MRISRIEQLPYEIPFAADFQTAHGELKKRRGLVLKVHTDSGLIGLGEVAPLPEFGGGTLEDATTILNLLAPQLLDETVEKLASLVGQKKLEERTGTAAVACGLDIAALDLLTQEQQVPLYAWQGFSPPSAKIEFVDVNATIGQATAQEAATAAKKAVQQGFACVKVKVGVAKTLEAEIERVATIRSAIGSATRLRIDANGAWKPEQAVRILQALEEFDIELVEQPVAAADIAGLAEVRRQVKILVAADEALISESAVDSLIAQQAADIAVIKPMLLGGLQTAHRLIKRLATAGIASFVTTSIDSGVGIAAALQLAATLPSSRLACGLATATLLTTTLTENPPLVQNGKMFLPQQPGLGVRLVEKDAAFL